MFPILAQFQPDFEKLLGLKFLALKPKIKRNSKIKFLLPGVIFFSSNNWQRNQLKSGE
jgi:hypothetical protein